MEIIMKNWDISFHLWTLLYNCYYLNYIRSKIVTYMIRFTQYIANGLKWRSFGSKSFSPIGACHIKEYKTSYKGPILFISFFYTDGPPLDRPRMRYRFYTTPIQNDYPYNKSWHNHSFEMYILTYFFVKIKNIF